MKTLEKVKRKFFSKNKYIKSIHISGTKKFSF